MLKLLTQRRLIAVVFVGTLCVPLLAFANAGVPMIVLTMPAMAVAFVPIVAMESVILRSSLSLSWWEAGTASLLSNLVSTVFGIPLAWGVFFLLEMAVGIPTVYLNIDMGPILSTILFAAWLTPDEQNVDWMIPLASMTLLVGFFYVSFWSETKMAQQIVSDRSKDQIRSAVWRANLASYAVLELIAAGFLAYAVIIKHARI